MRIITGRFKGKKLAVSPDREIRPPLERMKASFFNIIQRDVEGYNFLDLFAGTGSVGLEALSRGALRAVFAEKRPSALRVLEENLVKCELLAPFDSLVKMRPMLEGVDKDAFEILRLDVFDALDRLSARGEVFHIIFIDPPFNYPQTENLLRRIGEGELIEKDAIISLHHHKKQSIPDTAGVLRKYRVRFYGQSVLSFFRPAVSAEKSEE